MRESEARFKDGFGGDGPGVTSGCSLIQNTHIPVSISSGRSGDVRLVELVIFALIKSQEAGHPVVDLSINLGVVLIGIVTSQQQRFVVV